MTGGGAQPVGRPQLEVVVVGAGVSGLASGLALARQGHRVTVLERDAAGARSQSAGGWHLWANAVRALQQLGVAERVEAVGVHLERTRYLRASGGLLAEWDIGRIGRRVGARDLGISRERLHRVLAEELISAVGTDRLRFGSRVVAVRQGAGGPLEVQAEGGASLRCDLVVAADGIRSATRDAVFGTVVPRYAGYTQWQAIVPAVEPASGRRWLPAGVEQVIFGKGCRAVLHHVGDGDLFWAGIVYGPRGSQRLADPRAVLHERLSAFPAPVAQVVAGTRAVAISGHDIFDLPPRRRWVRGRVVLVGDAAHAMTTNLSQGACLALEDAAVLADCLAGTPGLDSALARYEQRRLPRALPISRRSRRVAALGGWTSTPACAVRDGALRIALRTVALRDHESFVAAAT